MSSEIARYSEETFESIKHVDEYGYEFWYARELQYVLEYTQWRRFADAIERAKLACSNSGYSASEHFAGAGKSSPSWAAPCRKTCRRRKSALSRLRASGKDASRGKSVRMCQIRCRHRWQIYERIGSLMR